MQRRKAVSAAGADSNVNSLASARSVAAETTLGSAKQRSPARSEWTTDTTEVSWKIGTQQAYEKPPEPPELDDDLGSGWIVALAASLFVYNLLLCLDYPVGPEHWDHKAMRRYTVNAWDVLFPPDANDWSWQLPDPVVPLAPWTGEAAVSSGFLEPPGTSAAALTLKGAQGVIELTAEGRVKAAATSRARGDPEYNPTDEAMVDRKPVVMRSLLTSRDWPALEQWTPDFIAEHLPTVRPHLSSQPTIRMHTIAAPMGQLSDISWPRGWKEENMATSEFFMGARNPAAASQQNADDAAGSKYKYPYLFLHDRDLPAAVREGIGSLAQLTVGWRKIEEVNTWFGCDGVATPPHYDAMHNSYVQVYGRKRVVLFPADSHNDMYLFPRVHPSGRMSQIDLNAINHTAFPRYDNAASKAVEVLLEPGDVLYIPPYWFHYVVAVGSDGAYGDCSMSVSVHTESEAARIRDQMLTHELPIKATWGKPERAAAIALYVTALFPSQDQRQEFLTALLSSRFDALDVDATVRGNSPGLTEVIATARSKFSATFSERRVRAAGGRTPLSDSNKHVMVEHARRFSRITRRIEGRSGLSEAEKAIELGNYIEDVVAATLGAEWVDPFLRALTLPDPAGADKIKSYGDE